MNIEVVNESAVYYYETCWAYDQQDGSKEGIIELYANDVKTAPIGAVWSVEDTDRYPNANRWFTVSVTKTYQDANGVLLIERNRNEECVKAIWIELHPNA